jgi:uncharacterized protein YjdB
MNNIIKYLVIVSIAAFAFVTYSCEESKQMPAGEEAFVYNTIKISETDYNADSVTIYLLKEQQLQLDYTLTPAEGVTFPELVWTSSNESVVTVTQNGLIAAQNIEGLSVVQLKPAIGFGATNATPAVTVNVLDHYVYMLTVSITNPLAAGEMIDVGQTFQFIAGCTTASGEAPTFAKYKWTSSNPSIARVDEKTGLVTGVAEGTATITCTADDQNPSPPSTTTTTTLVNVRQIIPIETFELINDVELAALGYGQEYQIRFNVTPSNATVSSIIWTSDNETAISIDNTGKLTVNAMDAAMATITATAGSIVRTLNVAVARGKLVYSFASQFTPWTVSTAGASVGNSDGTKTSIIMSNPSNEGTAKHRADINLVTNNSGAIMVAHPNVYRYLAVKIQFPTVLGAGNNSNGCIKLEMFDNPRTIGPVYCGSTASNQNNVYTIFGADAISASEPNVIVFDLFGTNWSGSFITNTNPYNLVQFKFVIADFPVAAPWTYDIYWVRTFRTMEELATFVSADN